MAFIRMMNPQDCASALVGLHRKEPHNWVVRMNEPKSVREKRGRTRKGESDPEFDQATMAEIAEFEAYEADIRALTRQVADNLQVEDPDYVGGAAAAPARPAAGARPRHTSPRANQNKHIIYEPKLEGLPPLPCSVCGTETTSHCKRCKTRYCSPDCQTGDWNMHQFVCRTSQYLAPRLQPGWWSEECQMAVLAKKSALNKFQRKPTEENLIAFKKKRWACREIHRAAKERCVAEQLNAETDNQSDSFPPPEAVVKTERMDEASFLPDIKLEKKPDLESLESDVLLEEWIEIEYEVKEEPIEYVEEEEVEYEEDEEMEDRKDFLLPGGTVGYT